MGACQPVALVAADAGVTPFALAQDATHLYWVDTYHNTVTRTDKAIGGATVVLAQTSGTLPASIAIDDAGLYWGDVIGVWRCASASCSVTQTLVANQTTGAVWSLAVDDVSAYWSEGFPSVWVAAKDAGSVLGTKLWASDASTPSVTNVATDGRRVYFTATDGLLHAVAVDGGTPIAIGTPDQAGSAGIALDTNRVYWTVDDPDGGTVQGAPLSTLAPAVIATKQNAPSFVASDGTRIYWVAATSSAPTSFSIVACTIASPCQPTVLASGYVNPQGLVVDDAAVYWTDLSSATAGSLWKLAK
jgi:hypothetical protein